MMVNISISKLVLIVLLIFTSSLCKAIDSKPWISHLDPYYDDLESNIASNPDIVLKKLLSEISENTSKTTKAQYFLLLSHVYYSLVFPKKSLEAAQNGLLNINRMKQPWLYHQLNISQSMAYDILSQSDKGLPACDKAIEWSKQNKDVELLLSTFVAKGYILISQVKYIKALDVLQQAYSLAPKDGRTTKAEIAGIIALVYEYRREGKLAIPYFEEALQYHRKKQNWVEISIALYGLGKAYCTSGDIKSCKKHLKESANISLEINDLQGEAYALKELAGILIRQKDYTTAEKYLLHSLTAFSQAENKFMLFDVNKVLSNLYIRTHQLEKAKKTIEDARKFVDAKTMPIQFIALQKIESDIDANQGDYQKAYFDLKNIMINERRQMSEQSTEQLHQLRTKYELDNKEKENVLLAKNLKLKSAKISLQEKQNKTLMLLFVMALIFSAFLLYLAHKISKNKKYFQRLANFDGLTGVNTRSRAIELLEKQFELAEIHQQSFCLAMLDLDHFKLVNDQFGHAVGDQVLKETGKLLKELFHVKCIKGRFGGEEFIIGFIDTSLTEAQAQLEFLRVEILNLKQKFIGFDIDVSMSIGLCNNSGHDNTDSMIKCSDDALYIAKNKGRNQLVLGDY